MIVDMHETDQKGVNPPWTASGLLRTKRRNILEKPKLHEFVHGAVVTPPYQHTASSLGAVIYVYFLCFRLPKDRLA